MSEKAPRCECGFIDGTKLPKLYPIYTFVDKHGVNTHIDSGRLRRSVLRNPPILQHIPVEEKLVKQFLETDAVDPQRVRQLLFEWLAGTRKFDPVILVQDGGFTNGRPDVLYVDGHHRYLVAHIAKLPSIPAYVLEPSRWKSFEIRGLPPLTHQRLKEMPLGERHY